MAEDAKADEFVAPLREQFAEQIRSTVRDLPAHQALQLADTLCSVQLALLAGLRVSYRATAKVDAEAIAEDWRRGMSIAEIAQKHKISRSTAYNYHPERVKPRRRTG